MDIELYGVGAVALIVGLVQLIKSLGLPAKYAGLVAVALGLAMSLGHAYLADEVAFKAVILGLALGLSAAGLYSTTKNAIEASSKK
jgi:ABC-type uncharacterized transport system permease subunit